MMTGSPAANLGAPKPKPSPNLKGTMVGVAPPDLSAAMPSAAARPAPKASNPNLKGTMVGVAPPSMDEIRKQAAAAQKAASPTPAAAAPKGPPANLKGTMIGLAPPNMGAEVEAAKAKLAAKKAEAAEARASAQEAAAPAEPPKAAAEPPNVSAAAASKSPPSQLKGTMIGVAPPNMQAQIAAARDAAAVRQAEKLVPEPQVQENDPPSEPDPLGGTVVGTSPFAPGGAHAGLDTAAGAAMDFNDDTPPAGSDAPTAAPPTVAHGDAADPVHPTTPSAPAPGISDPEPSSHYSPPGAPDRLPITKSSPGPILLIVAVLLIVATGVGFFLMGKSEPEEAGAENSDAAKAPTDEAPADAEK